MRYWLDTEFIERRTLCGNTIDLVSIGIVCEDGREYYAQSIEFSHEEASSWVRDNVFPSLAVCDKKYDDRYDRIGVALHLHSSRFEDGKYVRGKCGQDGCYWRTREQIRDEIKIFFNPSDGIEIWGWCSSYDHVAFCQLFGAMMALPKGYPHYIRDFQYILDERRISDDQLPTQDGNAHNALEDARHLKKLWGYIVKNDCWQ